MAVCLLQRKRPGTVPGRLGNFQGGPDGNRGRRLLRPGCREGIAQPQLLRFPVQRFRQLSGGGVGPGMVLALVVPGVDHERVALGLRLPLGDECALLFVEADEGLWQVSARVLEEFASATGLGLLAGAVSYQRSMRSLTGVSGGTNLPPGCCARFGRHFPGVIVLRLLAALAL